VCVCVCVCVYIYIYRGERERECVCVCACVCVYTHTHILHDIEKLVGQSNKKYLDNIECRVPRRCFRVLLVRQPCSGGTVASGRKYIISLAAVHFVCYAGVTYCGYMFNIY